MADEDDKPFDIRDLDAYNPKSYRQQLREDWDKFADWRSWLPDCLKFAGIMVVSFALAVAAWIVLVHGFRLAD